MRVVNVKYIKMYTEKYISVVLNILKVFLLVGYLIKTYNPCVQQYCNFRRD